MEIRVLSDADFRPWRKSDETLSNGQPLQTADLQALRLLISSSSNVVVCCHKSPDGDAVGSSLALAEYLRSQGKEVHVVLPDAAPAFLHWLPGYNTTLRYDKSPEEVKSVFSSADLICCMDFNTLSRVEDMKELVEESKASKLLIDHHLNPDVAAALTISRPEMSSTCELLFCLLWQLDAYTEMSMDCAMNIYCGMMTDTGGFTYNSTRPEIFFIISKVLAKGVDKDLAYNKVYHNFSTSCMRLRSYVMLKKMQVIEHLHAAFFSITRAEMRRFRFQKGDAEGLVNEPLKIKGLKLSISLREDTERPHLVLVSLRSSCGFHCEPVARQFFNGGGHADAAGGKLYCSIADAEQIAIKSILAFESELKKTD